jgi:hypothetical protein
VEYSATLSLKSKIIMMAVAKARNGPSMVEAAGEDRGWRAANDGGTWLVNANPKGPTKGQSNSKMGRQRVRADNEPNFKMGRQQAKANNEPNLKRADNGPGPTRAKT